MRTTTPTSTMYSAKTTTRYRSVSAEVAWEVLKTRQKEQAARPVVVGRGRSAAEYDIDSGEKRFEPSARNLGDVLLKSAAIKRYQLRHVGH